MPAYFQISKQDLNGFVHRISKINFSQLARLCPFQKVLIFTSTFFKFYLILCFISAYDFISQDFVSISIHVCVVMCVHVLPY